LSSLAALAVAVGVSGAQQGADTARPYVIRGRQVEARQRELTARVQRFHEQLAATLRRDAPELLPRLEPPPPIATGYQLLPRIVADPAPAQTPAVLQPVSYSWPWSETLIRREDEELTRLEDAAARAVKQPAPPLLDSILTQYRKLIDRKKLADADVSYNWLWQAAIARSPASFDRATRLSRALLERQSLRQSLGNERDSTVRATLADLIAKRSEEIDRGLATDIQRTSPPGFVRFTQQGSTWTITVPIVTDIQDSVFLAAFTSAVEETWRSRAEEVTYAVRLDIRTIAPHALYCGAAVTTQPPRSPTSDACAPPARGTAIDLQAHIARFPPGVAVLTTGAGSTHVTAGRAIVVSPHDAPRRMLAHEFGHLLGFRDAYLRGWRDAGADGYVVTELVVDPSDIMGNSKTGVVWASHFTRLLALKDVPALMQAGLDALYIRHDPGAAAARFRDALARDPQHYGATLQLAKALDASGIGAEAAQWWTRVLTLALEAGDSVTAATARKRLEQ
jgi:hypothetical protein